VCVCVCALQTKKKCSVCNLHPLQDLFSHGYHTLSRLLRAMLFIITCLIIRFIHTHTHTHTALSLSLSLSLSAYHQPLHVCVCVCVYVCVFEKVELFLPHSSAVQTKQIAMSASLSTALCYRVTAPLWSFLRPPFFTQYVRRGVCVCVCFVIIIIIIIIYYYYYYYCLILLLLLVLVFYINNIIL